ncbi:hypothetical protein AB0M43_23965 [Longispora sp. NPDC051575]|uniref:hypothetical protein n=1 Tax=Longispora sp. NPDC051575 TaxID=3154943 RepID=UPI00343E92F9
MTDDERTHATKTVRRARRIRRVRNLATYSPIAVLAGSGAIVDAAAGDGALARWTGWAMTAAAVVLTLALALVVVFQRWMRVHEWWPYLLAPATMVSFLVGTVAAAVTSPAHWFLAAVGWLLFFVVFTVAIRYVRRPLSASAPIWRQ